MQWDSEPPEKVFPTRSGPGFGVLGPPPGWEIKQSWKTDVAARQELENFPSKGALRGQDRENQRLIKVAIGYMAVGAMGVAFLVSIAFVLTWAFHICFGFSFLDQTGFQILHGLVTGLITFLFGGIVFPIIHNYFKSDDTE